MASSSKIEKEIKTLNTQKKTLKKRISELEGILKGLSKAIDKAVDEYNSAVDSCAKSLGSGIQTNYIDAVCTDVKNRKEGESAESSGLYDVIHNIELEKSRCNDDLEKLEKKIKNKQRELENAKQAENAASMLGAGSGGGRF